MSKRNYKVYGHWKIILPTLLLALFLNVIPYPNWLELIRPDWVTLVLFYWCLTTPKWLGVGHGWLLGLLLDLIQYTLFGQQALGKAIVAWIVVSAHQKLRQYPIWQQSVVVAAVSSIDIGIVLLVHYIANGIQPRLEYWWAAVFNMLLWPIVYTILRKLCQQNRMLQP